MQRSLIAFMTDYGHRDGFVGVCHGVVASLSPETRVIDLSHDVPPQDVRHGAVVLARAARHFPPAVYVGVVDPGVGSARRGIALRAGESVLIGPDNGLLVPAAERLGGIDEVHELTNSSWWLSDSDLTFHGRDIFVPVAARISAGAPLESAGEPVKPTELVRLPAPRAEFDDRTRTLTAEVTYVDGFGNVQLAGELPATEDSIGPVEVRVGDATRVVARARPAEVFDEVPAGDLLLYHDSDGRLALAVNRGRAADLLGVRGGDTVRLEVTR
ncbi:MAG TPA: SAM-dependent chlorinase/fluorinase [Actinopolymorphaceae bacterium]